MKLLRAAFVLIAALAIALAASNRVKASFVQTQQDQIGVYVLVNVTPAVAYHQGPSGDTIAMRMAMRGRGSALFTDTFQKVSPTEVAQQQAGVRVQAEVSPNPKGTLLYSNTPSVPINQVAGTTQTIPCAYTVTVDTPPTTSWTLDDGLSNDFGNGFPGGDLRNNTYLQAATPLPTSTPFIVYPDNNNTWNTKEKSSGMQTYCVTLTLSIPAAAGSGAYSTNAIYTLFY